MGQSTKVSINITSMMKSGQEAAQELEALTKSMDSVDVQSLQQDAATRAKIFASARRLCQRLESPWERIARMFWGEPWIVVSVQIASDMGLFEGLHNRNAPSSVEELSQAIGKDPVLVRKILRTLSAAGFVEQTGTDAYSTTSLSETMLTPDARQAVAFLLDGGFPYFAQIPDYVKQTSFATPTDMGAWQSFRKTKMTVYEWFGAHPEEMSNFVGLMKVWSATQEPWLDLYPIQSLLDGADEQGTILVDIAGGGGRDIEAFFQRYPQYAGRLVLQDRVEEVQAAKISEGIERMPYDLFGPQHVQGARIYFLHAILHNYTDDQAREILNHIKKSMKPGYSRLLAYEDTIKDHNPTELSCGMDLTMMATFGTSARTETEWKTLFQSADLKLINIYQSHQAGQCIMDFELLGETPST